MSKTSFIVSKDHIRSIKVPTADGKLVTEHTIKVRATDIELNEIKDNNNPRSHEDGQLKGRVVKDIIETIEQNPANFVTYNKGTVVIAETVTTQDEGAHNVLVTVNMPKDENKEDRRAAHGACDGATSMALVKRIQTKAKILAYEEVLEFREALHKKHPRKMANVELDTSASEYNKLNDNHQKIIAELADIRDVPELCAEYAGLDKILIPVTIYSGSVSEDFITGLCSARNTNKPVSKSSMADFKKEFDILKDVLDCQPYGDNIAYEENSSREIKVERVIQIINGFRRSFVQKSTGSHVSTNNPISSYNSKGSLVSLFARKADDDGSSVRNEFEEISGIMPDCLRLFDIIRRDIPLVYNEMGGKAGALGKPKKGLVIPEKDLPFISGNKDENLYFIDQTCKRHTNLGVLFPVLFAFRALIRFEGKQAVWEVDPFEFWEEHKENLVETIITKFKEELGQNPNVCGRSAGTYDHLRDKARILFLDTVRKAM
jgi:hypothetical protein